MHVCPCNACLPPPDGGNNGSPRGDATQQALLLGQAARHVHTLLAAHSEHLIQNGGVQHLGNKASAYALYLQHPSTLSEVQCHLCSATANALHLNTNAVQGVDAACVVLLPVSCICSLC